MSVTERIFTGGCCQPTRAQQRYDLAGGVRFSAKGVTGCDFGSPTADIYPTDERFPSTSGRTYQRDLDFGRRIP